MSLWLPNAVRPVGGDATGTDRLRARRACAGRRRPHARRLGTVGWPIMAELIDRLLRPVVAVALVGSLLAAAPTSAGALPPAADAGGPYSIAEGEPLVLDASGSTDPEGDPMTFAWDLDGDASFDDAFGPTPDVAWPTLVGLGRRRRRGVLDRRSHDRAPTGPTTTRRRS